MNTTAHEHRLLDALDSIFGFVGVCALDGRLIEVGGQTAHGSSLRDSQCSGRLIWETNPRSNIESAKSRLSEAIHNASLGESVRFQAACATCDTEAPLDVLVTPLPSPDEAIRAVAVIKLDLPARVPTTEAELDRQSL